MYIQYQFPLHLTSAQQQLISSKFTHITDGPSVVFIAKPKGTLMILSSKEDPNNHKLLELGMLIGTGLVMPVAKSMALKLGINSSPSL